MNKSKGCGKTTASKAVTDLDLQSIIDSGLDEKDRREVMKAVMASPDMLRRLEELILQNRLLKDWWQSAAKD